MYTLLQYIVSLLKKTKIIGFGGISLYEILRFVRKELQRDSIQGRAAAVAYNALLAMFPGVLFFFTLIAYLPITNFRETVFEVIEYLLPLQSYQLVHDSINNIKGIPTKGWWLVLGLMMALNFAASGVRALMRAFRKADNPDFMQLKFFENQAVSLGLTLLLISIVSVTVAAVIAGKTFISWVLLSMGTEKWFGQWLIKGFRTLLFFSLIFNSIASIYYLAPSKHTPWGYFTPGATLASLFCIVSTSLFSLFVNSFNPYDLVYGSIGTMIIVMILFYMISVGLIIGFEMNVAVFGTKKNE